MEKNPLVILAGPTAVGKSELSIALAKRIGGEIISADSMQVYKHMDIGSAKIMPAQMDGVPHHLLNILEPTESFNVALFKELADKALTDIYSRGHIPILVGGTGFYIQAVLYDIDFTENDEDASYRDELEKLAREQGNEVLYEMLREVDAASCEAIHQNNIKRVIRALEFHKKTGQRISEHNESQRQKASPYNFAYFVLNDDRAKIYQKIEERVDDMMENGLVEEVKKLADMGCTRDMVSMQGLGYKEILDFLDGKCTLEEAVALLKRDTRHFAKRQLTWFRRITDVIWIEKNGFDYDSQRILGYMTEILQEAGIPAQGETTTYRKRGIK